MPAVMPPSRIRPRRGTIVAFHQAVAGERSMGLRGHQMEEETREQRVNRELGELLNELRVALPGVQVLRIPVDHAVPSGVLENQQLRARRLFCDPAVDCSSDRAVGCAGGAAPVVVPEAGQRVDVVQVQSLRNLWTAFPGIVAVWCHIVGDVDPVRAASRPGDRGRRRGRRGCLVGHSPVVAAGQDASTCG